MKYIVELLEPVKYDKKHYTVGDRISVNEEVLKEIIKKKVGREIKPIQPPIEEGTGEVDATEEATADNYASMDYNDLRSIAKEKGISLGKTPKKDNLVAALQALEGE